MTLEDAEKLTMAPFGVPFTEEEGEAYVEAVNTVFCSLMSQEDLERAGFVKLRKEE